MGLGELMGVKNIKIETSQKYSIEELYDQIKCVDFEAGLPLLVNAGLGNVIAFPELDRNNQVQIVGSKGKFYVQRAVNPAGLDKLVENVFLDKATDGWSSMSGAFGNTKKRCMELCDKTAETLRGLNL